MDIGMLGVALVAEVAAIAVAAYVIGVAIKWASKFKHARQRQKRQRRQRIACRLVEEARTR
ncbi:hypothetical protein DMP23_00320 [Amycolatopsis sp. A1MSW2902]|uniref:hypothetical protein n=1 Tax=Amycolatopsis sp. A1MSW2902 TaxID=687413 RepID=UPI00307D18DA